MSSKKNTKEIKENIKLIDSLVGVLPESASIEEGKEERIKRHQTNN